jgi:hypothetical protein
MKTKLMVVKVKARDKTEGFLAVSRPSATNFKIVTNPLDAFSFRDMDEVAKACQKFVIPGDSQFPDGGDVVWLESMPQVMTYQFELTHLATIPAREYRRHGLADPPFPPPERIKDIGGFC